MRRIILMKTIELNEKIECRGSYDVIVAGGGVAGCAAALSAVRSGKSALIIEKSQIFGGLATLGLINFFVPMCNGRGKQIIYGMAEEFLSLSIKYGYDTIPEIWKNGDPANYPENGPRYITHYSADIFALALTEQLHTEGVDIMFDSVVSMPVMNGCHCDGLIIENKSGREYYEGKIIIDTTGDADVLYRAGVPTVQRGNFYTYIAKLITIDSCRKAAESGNIRDAMTGIAGGGSSLYGKGHPQGMPLFTGTTSKDVNNYLITNQLHMLSKLKQTDRFSRNVVTLPGMCQYRTTRRIDGDYVLREADVYRHFDDSVGAINDFDRRDYLYEIPYGTLICSKYDNLLTAGRSAAGEGYAWDVLRVIPPAIISGQAAGLAAAQAIDEACGVGAIDIRKLQASLEAGNVDIHFDDADIPEKDRRSAD